VNVVRTLDGLEGGIHRFDVETTVRKLRMAIGTRCASLLAVFLMTGEATEAFVYSNRCTIIAGSHLAASQRGVALVTESLAAIRTDLDNAGSFVHLREWQMAQRNVVLFATIKQCQGRPGNFLAGPRFVHLDRRACQG
jgi:hypothetical protein